MTIVPLTARYAEYAPTFAPQIRTAAQKAGLRYEAAIMRRLGALHTTEVGPWIHYTTSQRSNVCQPDALVWLTPTLLCVVEVKLTHVKDARRKLLDFYGPIIKRLHPKATLCYLQIYKTFKKGAHKRSVSIFDLESLKPESYKECQCLL